MDNLIRTSSLILCKFTEGKEDWAEFDDLARSIELAAGDASPRVRDMAIRRVKEFERRQLEIVAKRDTVP